MWREGCRDGWIEVDIGFDVRVRRWIESITIPHEPSLLTTSYVHISILSEQYTRHNPCELNAL